MPKGGASKVRRVSAPGRVALGGARAGAAGGRAIRCAAAAVTFDRDAACRGGQSPRARARRRRSRMAALETRAEIDPLTDLINRRGLERELKRALAYVKRYATSAVLVYLDLDGFKSINDRHGHAAGDTVLKAVAMGSPAKCAPPTWWRAWAATSSSCCCGTSTRPRRRSKRVRWRPRSAASTAPHGGALLAVGASAGNTMLLPLDTPASVLERADRAMYLRKTGRSSARAAAAEPR